MYIFKNVCREINIEYCNKLKLERCKNVLY